MGLGYLVMMVRVENIWMRFGDEVRDVNRVSVIYKRYRFNCNFFGNI